MSYEDKIASYVDNLSDGFRHSNLSTEDGKVILSLMRASYNAAIRHTEEFINESKESPFGISRKTFTDFLKKKFK